MPFDITGSPEPVRFYFDKDQIEWVDLRLVDDDEKQAIREKVGIKVNEMVYMPNAARENALELVPAIVPNEEIEAFVRELNFAGIPAWHLVDKQGKEIPHSIENVDLMIRKSKRFASFIKRNLVQLRKDQDADLEAEIKNS